MMYFWIDATVGWSRSKGYPFEDWRIEPNSVDSYSQLNILTKAICLSVSLTLTTVKKLRSEGTFSHAQHYCLVHWGRKLLAWPGSCFRWMIDILSTWTSIVFIYSSDCLLFEYHSLVTKKGEKLQQPRCTHLNKFLLSKSLLKVSWLALADLSL